MKRASVDCCEVGPSLWGLRIFTDLSVDKSVRACLPLAGAEDAPARGRRRTDYQPTLMPSPPRPPLCAPADRIVRRATGAPLRAIRGRICRSASPSQSPGAGMTAPPPVAMLAELTHRCPLACPYCSNPMELTRRSESSTPRPGSTCSREAADLGVLHLHLSGGEPLSRRDLEPLVAGAPAAGSTPTSSPRDRADRAAAGRARRGRARPCATVRCKGPTLRMADRIGGYRGGFARKMAAAGWIARGRAAADAELRDAPAEHAPARRGDRDGRALGAAAARGRDTCSSTAGPWRTAPR